MVELSSDFHEALNGIRMAITSDFVVENNQWGLSTPSKEQFNCKQFIDKGVGYEMETFVDGNKVDEGAKHSEIKETKK